jgi:hypothetical protein
MHSVLMDVAGAYVSKSVPRIESLDRLLAAISGL